MPTLAERSGNFASDNISSTIYDPLTYNTTTGSSSPFSGNVIPSTRFNAFANLWLKNYPLPNFPLGSANMVLPQNVWVAEAAEASKEAASPQLVG